MPAARALQHVLQMRCTSGCAENKKAGPRDYPGRLCMLCNSACFASGYLDTEHHARPHKDRAMHCCRAIQVNIFQLVEIRFPGCYVFIDKFIRSALQRRAGGWNKGIVNSAISAIPGAGPVQVEAGIANL